MILPICLMKFLYLKDALVDDPGFFNENKLYQKTYRNFDFSGYSQDIVLLYYDPPQINRTACGC